MRNLRLPRALGKLVSPNEPSLGKGDYIGLPSTRTAAEETTRYETLEGALACLIEDFRLSGIRANPDHPSLFNGHQS